jgi:hypothetical protein
MARRCSGHDTFRADSGGMTASLYVSDAHVASAELDPAAAGRGENIVAGVAHAVAKPVVDGLESAVCGVLVTAIADLEWDAVPGLQRCDECQRIAG